jgi:DNA-binding MarR family transcriptional regulator
MALDNLTATDSIKYTCDMQLLRAASNTVPMRSSRAILDGVPAVMWFIRRHMRRHRANGLSVPQFRMLVLVDRYPTLSLSMAAEHLGVSLPGASRMISGLVSKGLVARRENSKDRRQVTLMLSSRGRAVLNNAREATQACLAEELKDLSESQQQTIAESMHLLQSVFGSKC